MTPLTREQIAAIRKDFILVPRVPTENMVVRGFEAAFECEEAQDDDTRGTCAGAAEVARETYLAMLTVADNANLPALLDIAEAVANGATGTTYDDRDGDNICVILDHKAIPAGQSVLVLPLAGEVAQ